MGEVTSASGVVDRREAAGLAGATPFLRDVLAGLGRPARSIPSRWLYDARGSELFREIMSLEAYYPTRTEHEILERDAASRRAQGPDGGLSVARAACIGGVRSTSYASLTITVVLAAIFLRARMAVFFAIGLTVSSGVMIYPIIRAMFPVRIVGTALTSLNFFVLMGAATTQQAMGLIVGAGGRSGSTVPGAFHTAFLLPVAALAVTIVCFSFARDYTDLK